MATPLVMEMVVVVVGLVKLSTSGRLSWWEGRASCRASTPGWREWRSGSRQCVAKVSRAPHPCWMAGGPYIKCLGQRRQA